MLEWLQRMLLLVLQYLIKLFKQESNEESENEQEQVSYTRDDFVNVVKELSNDPVWRARILRDTLDKMKERFVNIEGRWIDREEIIKQTTNRRFGCGVTFSFGDGIYALKRVDWERLIGILQQNIIKWTAEIGDCDNIATFFKGFADYVVGKPVVIYTTGMVFKAVEQYGVKTCICRSEYLVGGHAFCRIVVDGEPITVEKVGTTEKLSFDFTVYNYEPQNDQLGDRILGSWCYMDGGKLPVIYGKCNM